MQYVDYAAELGSAQKYEKLLSDGDQYRMMNQARNARAVRPRRYRLVERLGASLIELGRTLCERRGELAVEVAFHTAHSAGNPHDRHVA